MLSDALMTGPYGTRTAGTVNASLDDALDAEKSPSGASSQEPRGQTPALRPQQSDASRNDRWVHAGASRRRLRRWRGLGTGPNGSGGRHHGAQGRRRRAPTPRTTVPALAG